jgi:hypothetical protein
MGFYIQELGDESEGPVLDSRIGFTGWEIEVKPWDWLGLKGERTALPGRSSLGLVFYLLREWVGCDPRLELNLGHDRFDYRVALPTAS